MGGLVGRWVGWLERGWVGGWAGGRAGGGGWVGMYAAVKVSGCKSIVMHICLYEWICIRTCIHIFSKNITHNSRHDIVYYNIT